MTSAVVEDKKVSTKRIVMFVSAIGVGLASGSNYVYSGYAPQLAAKLNITSTQSNLVGLGGNLGVYLTGPFWGYIVDKHGQRVPLLSATFLNFFGYLFISWFYRGVIPIRTSDDIDTPASPLLLTLLILAMAMTGAAGSAGLAAGMNAVAKSFPDKLRASATGSVLAGFGLSAFFFSSISRTLGGSTAGFLRVLAIGTAVPMFIGAILVKPYPPAQAGEYEPVPADYHDQDDHRDADLSLSRQVSQGVRPEEIHDPRLAVSHDLELARSHSGSLAHRSHEYERDGDRADAASPPPSPQDPLLQRNIGHKRYDSDESLPPTAIHYSPYDLIGKVDFWLLFAILALLCGIGLEWINNVGAVTLALARDGWKYDPHKVKKLQATQVSTISIFNCLGRVVGGALSDFMRLRFGIKRIWFLPLVALMFLGSQVAVLDTEQVKHLWMVSSALGFAYGSLFNALPMLVLEWFGMTHFSQNWGWTSVAPIIGGNVFNMIFGRVYDSNTVGRVGEPAGSLVAGEAIRRAMRSLDNVGVERAALVSSGASDLVSAVMRLTLGGTAAGGGGVVPRGPSGAGVSGFAYAADLVPGPSGPDGPDGGPGTILAHIARAAATAAAVTTAAASGAGTESEKGGSGDHSHECLLGVKCYATAFKLSALGCIVALVLAIIAGVRRERRSHRSRRQSI